MDKKRIDTFLKSLTYDTKYSILEAGKDDDELTQIAEDHKIKLPAKDLSIFKGKYAFVDEENKNGCTLPKKEVEKALITLGGKAVDFDHLRKRVVGHWLEAKVEGDEIIGYGIFYKGNFGEDYDTITDLMDKGNLKISFEAWGNREFKDGGGYDLTDIEFAGGALLVDTQPAFAEAEVLELAKNMKAPTSFLHTAKDEKRAPEWARFSAYDFDSILSLVNQVVPEEADKDEFGWHVIDMVDFANGKVKSRYMPDDIALNIDITPRIEGKRESAKTRKLIKVTTLDKSANADNNKTDKSEESNKMDEQLKKLQGELASLKANVEAKDEKIASLEKKVQDQEKANADLKVELDTAKTEIDNVNTAKEEAVKVAREEATKVAERKSTLGEFAKEMKDEDILNDDKYEIAKLKKENAELKQGKNSNEEEELEESSEESEEDLTVGSNNKGKDSEIEKAQARVKELAFGKQD